MGQTKCPFKSSIHSRSIIVLKDETTSKDWSFCVLTGRESSSHVISCANHLRIYTKSLLNSIRPSFSHSSCTCTYICVSVCNNNVHARTYIMERQEPLGCKSFLKHPHTYTHIWRFIHIIEVISILQSLGCNAYFLLYCIYVSDYPVSTLVDNNNAPYQFF